MIKQVKLMALVAFMLVAGVAMAQTEEETRDVSGFDGVHVATGVSATLTQGGSEGIRIEATDIPLDKVKTEVSKGILKVYIKTDSKKYRGAKVKVYITYSSLESLKASSAGSINVESDLSADEFEADASSAGSIKIKRLEAGEFEAEASSSGSIIADVEADQVEAGASSAGKVELSGSAKEIEAGASSAGSVFAEDLKAGTGEARASSGGVVKVYVTGELEASASSGGDVRYKGTDNVEASKSSGGSVKKM